MATQPTLDAANQQFDNWLMGFIGFVQLHYGILLIPSVVQIATPGVNSTNPQEVDEFYLYSPQYQSMFYMGQAMQQLFLNRESDLAAIVLTTMAYPDPAPQPLPTMVPPSAPRPISVPTNPIGNSFIAVTGEADFVDLGSPTIPVGGTYTAPDGTVYLKKGNNTPFGLQTWFVKA